MKSDMKTQHDILNELDFEPMIDASQISVTVKSGVATLKGAVRDYRQKWVAEWAAKKIGGVKAIANTIDVQLLPRDVRGDEDLSAAIAYHFGWDVIVPSENIKVTVSRGSVTLQGTVSEQHQRQKAEEIVRDLIGVREIANLITVAPKALTSDFKSRIDEALKRLVEPDADNIEVEVKEGTATLAGEVHFWAEREEAERIVWASPGVLQVENNIKIVEPSREVPPSPLDL
jgi:osmotically-inducible protein OsmY